MDTTNEDSICVQVFSKITAAISHELKNTLSIINENAGLLNDLALLAEQSGGLPLARVQTITGKITNQVERSNRILKNVNRFAHSGDNKIAHADLHETLSLMVALTDRQAAMKNITITIDCPDDITLYTYLIGLESLIYLTLLTISDNISEGTSLAVRASTKGSNIILRFDTPEQTELSPAFYPDANQQILVELVKASCQWQDNQLLLSFPAKIE